MGLPLIAVVPVDHCTGAQALHSSGKKLVDLADVLVDNCTPGGDALVHVPGLDDPVGPSSTIGAVAVTNAIKCLVTEILAAAGKPPIVLISEVLIGAEASRRRLDEYYDDYRR